MYIDTPIVKCIKAKIVAAKSIQHITIINLNNIKTSVIPNEAKQLLEKCTHLFQLNFTDCGLQSLDNLPRLELTVLLLDGNHLKDQELDKLAIYKNSLELLSLSKNHLHSISNFTLFRNFSRLSELNLKDNPLCQQYMSYNRKIFDQVLSKNQQLTLIDCYMRNGETLQDDDEKNGAQFDHLDLMIEEEESSNQSGNHESIQERKSISSEQNTQKIDLNMITLYQQYQYVDPSRMVELLNENQMGLMGDPLDECFVQELQEDQMQIEEEVQAEGSKCTVTKKIKYDTPVNNDDVDY